MGLVRVLSDDLLYGELTTRFYVTAQPDKTEPTATQQLHLLETVRKTLTESVLFFLCETERL